MKSIPRLRCRCLCNGRFAGKGKEAGSGLVAGNPGRYEKGEGVAFVESGDCDGGNSRSLVSDTNGSTTLPFVICGFYLELISRMRAVSARPGNSLNVRNSGESTTLFTTAGLLLSVAFSKIARRPK